MSKKKNPVWRFFASVKLALISLIILAITSIIGTLIQQGKDPSYYVQEYGPSLARLFEILDVTTMYSSWWYIALLSLFAVNLIVCSVERLPGVWHMVMLDNLATDPGQLEKKSSTFRTDAGLPVRESADRMHQLLIGAGWKNPRRLDQENSVLLFAQKGAWTRLGVYVVHLSILIILAGAMIGTFFGFKAYVFIPEGRDTGSVFLQRSKEPLSLGFKLQCDRFEKTFYPNGMVKQFRSDLTVIDPDREKPIQKSIIVNDPLSWRGITFYLADSYPLEEFFVVISNRTTGQEQAFRVPPDREVAWQAEGVSFRVDELKQSQDGAVSRARIRLAAPAAAEPTVFWINDKTTMAIGRPGEEITVSFRQLYSTLLLAIKDPGVPILFFGCGLMVVGLAISFFLSHQRIWVQVTPRGKEGSRILLSGAGNKNKPAFERRFQDLINRFRQDLFAVSKEKDQ